MIMGLIKEPANVDFTVISTKWTANEEKEFSELIKRQKEMRNKKSVCLSTSSHVISKKRTSLRKKKTIA